MNNLSPVSTMVLYIDAAANLIPNNV